MKQRLFKNLYLLIFVCAGSSLLHGLFSSCGEWGLLQLQCTGFSLPRLLLSQSTGSMRVGSSSCSTCAQYLLFLGSRTKAQWLWCIGLVAPWHVGSSWARDQTHVPCIGRHILNHWTPGRSHPSSVLQQKYFCNYQLLCHFSFSFCLFP